MSKVIIISDAKDLCMDKLDKDKYIILFKNDIDMKDINFKPIDASNSSIIIYGNNKTIENLTINNTLENTGLFSKTKNLYVKNLSIKNCLINSGVVAGTLVGECEIANLFDVNIDTNINSEAYAGGVAGISKKLIANECVVTGNISGYDVIGGFVGLTDEFNGCNDNVSCILNSKGKANGIYYGYSSAENEEKICYMLKEALKDLEPECTYEEMKKLELSLKDPNYFL